MAKKRKRKSVHVESHPTEEEIRAYVETCRRKKRHTKRLDQMLACPRCGPIAELYWP